VNRIDVIAEGRIIGTQRFRLLSPDTAFKITGFEVVRPRSENEMRRLLRHTSLNHIQWVNSGRSTVTFKTLSK
jgi:hypothetical protein